MIPAILLLIDESRLEQYLDVMGNRGLCEVYDLVQFGALPASSPFRDILQYLQAILIA